MRPDWVILPMNLLLKVVWHIAFVIWWVICCYICHGFMTVGRWYAKHWGRSTAICLVETFRWITVVLLCNRLEWLDPICTEVKDEDPTCWDNFLPDKCQYIFFSKVNFIQVPSISLFWMYRVCQVWFFPC
jgi:hypothetical protein